MSQPLKADDRASEADRAARLAGSVAQPAIEVAAGLIFRADQLLITQRRADDHLGGLWEFPGGKREPGESFEQCLKRELREELGIEIGAVELFEAVTHAYPEKTVFLKFFRCRLASGEPRALGCAALRWVSREALMAHTFPAADAKLLSRLTQELDSWR